MKKIFVLAHDDARIRAANAILAAPDGYCVSIMEPKRTLEQNALLWPLLEVLSNRVIWHGVQLSPEDWKDLLTASLKGQRSAPGINGGFVIFGERTRTYCKQEFSELIELIYAFGVEHGINWGNEHDDKND